MRLFRDKLFRNIFISVVLLALLGGAYYFVMNMPEEETPDDTPVTSFSDDSIEIFKADIKDIKEIYIKNADGEYSIIHDTIKEKNADGEEFDRTIYKIKNSKIEYSSSKLQGQYYTFSSISALKELDESGDYGLDTPAAQVEIVLNDGSENVLYIGNKVIGGSGYFAKMAEKTYNVSDYVAEAVFADKNSFRDTDLATFDMASLKKFNVKTPDEDIKIRPIEDEEASKFPKTTSIIMTTPKYVGVSADYLNKVITNITGITVNKFISDERSSWGEYGLTSPVLTFEFADSETDIKVYYGNKAENGDVYARIEGSDTVFTQDSLIFDTLITVTSEALADKLVNLVNIEDIKTVTIIGEGKEYTMKVEGKEDKMKFFLDGKTANESAFKKTYQEIIGITSNGFSENDGSGDSLYTIKYEYKDGTKQTLEFINYDERNFILDLNGNREYIVLKKKLSAMMAKIGEFAKDPGKEPED